MSSPSLPVDPEVRLRGLLLRRNWPLPALCLVITAGSWLALRGHPYEPFGGAALAVALFFAVACVWRNAFPRGTPVDIRVTPEALTIGDAPAIAVDAISEAKAIIGETGKPEVHLGLHGGETRWLRLDRPGAESLLQTLGLAGGGRRATFALQTAFTSRFTAMSLLVGLPLWWQARDRTELTGEPVLLALVLFFELMPLVLTLAWVTGLVVRGRAVIGANGVAISWPGRRRFVPFRDVARLERRKRWRSQLPPDNLVRLRDGRTLRLIARDDPTTSAQVGAESAALWVHLEQAFSDAQSRAAAEHSLGPLLTRGTHDDAGWLQSLDSLAHERGARYRVAAPTTERLVAVVQDPASPAEERVGAATALLRHGEQTGRVAVRVAAAGCADRDLREALLRLEAARDDADFTAALASIARRHQG